METTDQATRRPFHETIVNAIRSAADGSELGILGRLIRATTIPKNHDKIIAAWQQNVREVWRPPEYENVLADLLEQKEEAEKKEGEKRAKEQAAAATSVEAK